MDLIISILYIILFIRLIIVTRNIEKSRKKLDELLEITKDYKITNKVLEEIKKEMDNILRGIN